MSTRDITCRLAAVTDSHAGRQRLSVVMIAAAVTFWIVSCVWLLYAENEHARTRSAQQALITALAASDAAVVVADAEGTITAISTQAAQFFGPGLVGTSVHALCPSPYRERANRALAAATAEVARTGVPRIVQTSCVIHDVHRGRPEPVQMTIHTARQGNGAVMAVMTLIPQQQIQAVPQLLDAQAQHD